MNSKHKPNRPNVSFHSSIIGFQGDSSRRKDSRRAVTPNSNDVNPESVFDTAQAIRESIEEAFGRPAAQPRKQA